MNTEALYGSSIFTTSDQSSEHQAKLANLRHLLANTQQGTAHHDISHPNQHTPSVQENRFQGWYPGISEVDEAVPCRGLSTTAVHELGGATYGDVGAASGYGLGLLRQLVQTAPAAPILWCQTRRSQQEFGTLHGLGLKAFGFHANQFLFAEASHSRDVLWALEEGARSKSLLAVVGEVDTVSFTQTRRLVMAAAKGRTPVLLLRAHNDASVSAAETRWRIAAVPGAADPFVASVPGNPRWQVELTRCRGGRPGSWIVEWSNETHRFSLAEQFSYRSPQVADAPVSSEKVHILQRRFASG